MRVFDSNTTVIAHSIGCAFIVKYLLEKGMILGNLILVAPFNNYLVGNKNYDYVNQSFFEENLEGIQYMVGEITCIYSDNDPYVEMDASKNFAKEIESKEVIIPDGGHFNSEVGYEEFEELLEYI